MASTVPRRGSDDPTRKALRALLPPTPAQVVQHHLKVHNMLTSHAKATLSSVAPPNFFGRPRSQSASFVVDGSDTVPSSPKPVVRSRNLSRTEQLNLGENNSDSCSVSSTNNVDSIVPILSSLVGGEEKLKSMLEELRSSLRKKNCEKGAEYSDSDLCRFLKARKLNVEKASAQVVHAVKLFEEYSLDTVLSEDWAYYDARGFLEVLGEDDKGRPVAVLRAGRHFPKDQTPKEATRYILYYIEKLKSDYPNCDKVALIFDIGNGASPKKNLDFGFMRTSLPMLQTCYPERMGAVYVCPADPFFWGIWRIVSTFLDEDTKAKFNIFGKDYKLKLREHLPTEVLENEYPLDGSERKASSHLHRTMSLPSMRQQGR